MTAKAMTKMIDASSAKLRFGELMKKAESENTRFIVSRRGRPTVVVLSVEDFSRNIIKQPNVLTSIQLDATNAGMEDISQEEIEKEITGYRAESKK